MTSSLINIRIKIQDEAIGWQIKRNFQETTESIYAFIGILDAIKLEQHEKLEKLKKNKHVDNID